MHAYLIANNIDVRVDCPLEVIPGLYLRRPTGEELECLRPLVSECCKGGMGWIAPYETQWVKEEPNTISYSLKSLEDPNEWKYWLLADESGGSKAHEFAEIVQIVNPVIELGPRIFTAKQRGDKTLFGHSSISHPIAERQWGFGGGDQGIADVLQEKELNQIRALHNQLDAISSEHKVILSSIKTFCEVCKLSKHANLRIVGIFSVIESLITHAPRLTETLDSISHQISGKMILLDRRFEETKNRPEVFGDVSDQKLWKKLYAYRSKVAHGQEPAFTGTLSVLGDHGTVHQFLFEKCQALLRYSIKEPQLVADLREC